MSKIYLHPKFGRVEVLEEHHGEMLVVPMDDSHLDSCILGETPKYDVDISDMGEDSLPNMKYGMGIKTTWVLPCELIELDTVKEHLKEVQNTQLYAIYGDASDDDTTMYGDSEFVYVVANLPRKKTKVIRRDGEFIRLSSPMVVVMGECSGRIYTAYAWTLRSLHPDENGKRYQWQDPKTQAKPLPPEFFAYNPNSSNNDEYSGINHDADIPVEMVKVRQKIS